MSDQIFWYATRAAGILAWFAATISLGVGLTMSSRLLGRRPTIPWLLDVHRYFGAMSIVFLLAHLATLWADAFVTLSVSDFIIPGQARVQGLSPMSLAWGVLSAWILVLVQASSLIKKYLPAQFWHTLHLTSFGVVIMGLVHAFQTGSDVDNRALMALTVSLLTAIVLVMVTRLFRVLSDRKYRYELTIEELGGEPALTEQIEIIHDEDLNLTSHYQDTEFEESVFASRGPSRLPAPPSHRESR